MESKGFQSHLSVGNVALMGGSEKFPDVMLGLNQLEKCFSLIYHEKLPSSGKQIEKKKRTLAALKSNSLILLIARPAEPAGFSLPSSSSLSLPQSRRNVAACSAFALQSHVSLTPFLILHYKL